MGLDDFLNFKTFYPPPPMLKRLYRWLAATDSQYPIRPAYSFVGRLILLLAAIALLVGLVGRLVGL